MVPNIETLAVDKLQLIAAQYPATWATPLLFLSLHPVSQSCGFAFAGCFAKGPLVALLATRRRS